MVIGVNGGYMFKYQQLSIDYCRENQRVDQSRSEKALAANPQQSVIYTYEVVSPREVNTEISWATTPSINTREGVGGVLLITIF